MDKCFNKDVCMILKSAEGEMLNLRHPYVGTEHLLLALLKRDRVKKICYKFNLTYTGFRDELVRLIGQASKKSEVILYTPLLKLVIDNAYNKSYDEHKEMDELYLLSSLFGESDGIALRVAYNMGVDTDALVKELDKPKILSSIGVCLTDKEIDKIYLRDKELDEVMEILLRKGKNNPLLVGDPGVGKTAIAYELARRIKCGNVPDRLKGKEVYLVSTSSLVSGTKYRGEFEERVNGLINEVIRNGNIILFIDEIHTIMKTGSSEAGVDGANILKPYLARNDLKIIGATTKREYDEYLKKDGAFARRFAKVIVNEPSLKDTVTILNKLKKSYEEFYNLKINSNVIKYLVDLCDKYLPNSYNPDKSIDILDTSLSKIALEGKKRILTKEDVYEVISKRCNISLVSDENLDKVRAVLSDKYSEVLAVNVVKMFKCRDKSKYMVFSGSDDKRRAPFDIGKCLGVNVIDIDCALYNDEYSLNKFVSTNYLYNKISENPFSLVVFDNYNKRGRVLDNIIRMMKDKGYIENSMNERLYLDKAVMFLIDEEVNNKVGFAAS
ncbi:MAG: ATP-dependent Clp protease ATP-binding subunit [Bacilli bacterium]|nr:ATP-dependent Clp protease ATP-binding subunit [Bacilli bacterium]